MFGLNPYGLALKAAVLLAVAIGSFWSGHQVTHNAWEAAQADIIKAEVDKATAASIKTEQKQEKVRVVNRTVTKLVDRIVDRPVYRNVCLDADGLRAANGALTNSAGEPDRPMPAAKPPG